MAGGLRHRSPPEDLHENDSAHLRRLELGGVDHQRFLSEDDVARIFHVSLHRAAGICALEMALFPNLLRGIEKAKTLGSALNN